VEITVTGGHGFIGSATVDVGKSRGHSMRPFDRTTGNDVHYIRPEDCGDAVIHLAGMLGTAELFDDPYAAVHENVNGTLAVIQACEVAGAKLVLIGMPMVWRNVYQTTKACAAGLANAWMEHRGLHVSHVRAFNAYGPGQHLHPVRKILPTFANAAWRGEPIEIWGSGESLVDLIYVDALAEVLVRTAEMAPGKGEVIEAGTGVGQTVNSVADTVNHHVWLAGSATDIVHAPMRPGEAEFTDGTVATGEGLDLIGMTLADLRDPYGEAFGRTVDWYREDRP